MKKQSRRLVSFEVISPQRNISAGAHAAIITVNYRLDRQKKTRMYGYIITDYYISDLPAKDKARIMFKGFKQQLNIKHT